MNKKIFIGFDNTVVDTRKALVEIYNSLYSESVNVKSIKRLDMMDSCIYLGERFNGDIQKDLSSILSSDDFWTKLELLNGVTDTLLKLKKDGYELLLYVDSKTYNLGAFQQFVKKELTMVDSIIQLEPDDATSQMNMSGCFNINHIVSILQSTNAQTKIVVGKELKGNRNPGYFTIINWEEVIPYINQIYEMSMI